MPVTQTFTLAFVTLEVSMERRKGQSPRECGPRSQTGWHKNLGGGCGWGPESLQPASTDPRHTCLLMPAATQAQTLQLFKSQKCWAAGGLSRVWAQVLVSGF